MNWPITGTDHEKQYHLFGVTETVRITYLRNHLVIQCGLSLSVGGVCMELHVHVHTAPFAIALVNSTSAGGSFCANKTISISYMVASRVVFFP